MKIIIAPGAFKNSLSATQAAQAIETGLVRSGLQADWVRLPIADGGNGTLDAMLAAASNGERISLTVRGPLGRPVPAEYGLIDDGQTAVIEMALASGMELLLPQELDPMKATTYGTGQLMQDALNRGAKRFIVGMGGSATVDGGAGCLSALGVKLLDSNGRPVMQPGGGVLKRVTAVDVSGIDPRWQHCQIQVAVDVENPTLGPNGAAAVFGPQKGASPSQVDMLETGLTHFVEALQQATGVDVRDLKGGGAAGGFSAGLVACLDAEIVSGIDLVLKYLDFESHLESTDLIVTGEGQMDEQTIAGKGPFGVALRARAKGVPTIALVGGLDVDASVLHDAGLAAVIPVVPKPMPLEDALLDAAPILEHAALRLGYVLQVLR